MVVSKIQVSDPGPSWPSYFREYSDNCHVAIAMYCGEFENSLDFTFLYGIIIENQGIGATSLTHYHTIPTFDAPEKETF